MADGWLAQIRLPVDPESASALLQLLSTTPLAALAPAPAATVESKGDMASSSPSLRQEFVTLAAKLIVSSRWPCSVCRSCPVVSLTLSLTHVW